jgi:hypothetical protein
VIDPMPPLKNDLAANIATGLFAATRYRHYGHCTFSMGFPTIFPSPMRQLISPLSKQIAYQRMTKQK